MEFSHSFFPSSLSLCVQTDLDAGITAALMAVQRRLELDLAAREQALQLTVGGNQPVDCAGSAPLSCDDAAAAALLLVWTQIFLLLFTQLHN